MLNFHRTSLSTSTGQEMHTEELLRNLGRFPSSVLPIGVLKELQSRGGAIHNHLVSRLTTAIDSLNLGVGSHSNSDFFAFALFTPIAKVDDRPLIESLVTLPEEFTDRFLGDLIHQALPHLLANLFTELNASELIDWIDQLADHPNVSDFNASTLLRSLKVAVAIGRLDQTAAIDAVVHRLKKRADQSYDFQSAMLVCELMDLSARDVETVDQVVRSCFQHNQIDTCRCALAWSCWPCTPGAAAIGNTGNEKEPLADALRRAADKRDVAFQSGELRRIDAVQLAETFLLIVEELDSPLPEPAAVRIQIENADIFTSPKTRPRRQSTNPRPNRPTFAT